MQLRLASFGNLPCSVVLALATVACGGSVPAPSTSAAAVDSSGEASSSTDSEGAPQGGKAGESSVGAEVSVNKQACIDFRFLLEGELVLKSGLRLSEKAGASELTKCLGSPTREKTYPSGEASLFHDEQGLVLWTSGAELTGVGLNFNWDGDKKFPETSFTGSLMMGDLKVDRSTTAAQLQSLKGITCPDDSMCAGGTANAKFIIGFEKNVITQIGFLFHKK